MAKKLTGTVSQVIGPVIDVHFPAGRLPAINNALTVPIGDKTLTVEVAQHIGGNTVRCIAMESTDGLKRGETVTDTGAAISVPVGRKTLGRIFNVLGDPVDENQPRRTVHIGLFTARLPHMRSFPLPPKFLKRASKSLT